MKKNVLVTVLDSLNYTTMPYNEFIIYRERKYPDEEQVVLLTGNEILIKDEDIPKNLKIYKVGKNPFRIRKALYMIKKDCYGKGKSLVIHFHSLRGSLSTMIAMLGTLKYKWTLLTIHSTYTGYKLHNKVFSFIVSLFSHYTICVSNTSYNRFPSILKFLKKDRILAIQNGVNLERIDSGKTTLIADNTERKIRFVYIARFVPLKNHLFLIDVLKELREMGVDNIKFIFIGAETDNNKTRNYACEKGVIDMIEFTGLVPREQVYKLLKQSNVYISSSTLEGLPVSVLEAMYCGLPCVLSDIPQHREVATSCSAVKVLPFEANIWARYIKELSGTPIANLFTMGLNCKEHILENFTLESMHKKYDLIYDNIRNS